MHHQSLKGKCSRLISSRVLVIEKYSLIMVDDSHKLSLREGFSIKILGDAWVSVLKQLVNIAMLPGLEHFGLDFSGFCALK